MSVRALIVGLLAAAVLPIARPDALEAQIRPTPRRTPTPVRARGDTVGGRRDTTRADTSAADSAKAARLRLSEPDSVMRALMSKPGYTITRYEGQRVTFDATDQLFQILAEQSKRAIVQRDSAVVVTDSAIFYNEHNKVANAIGSDILLHDPTSGQADVSARGRLQYDLSERSARVTNPVFMANTGESWYIRAVQGKVVLPDSTRHDPSFYGLGGQITSCSDSIPDYHFEVREVKRSGGNTLVARPAVLYIKDIPVAWLPFLFQDTRPGRHSGILPPRFGLSDIIRNSPAYRRNVENLGYYWDISDYMDASTWLDWRSAAGGNDLDPGWIRFNGEWRYNWLDRFLSGNIASSYQRLRDGRTNLAVTWGHQQSFTRDRRLSLSANYVTSTMIQRQTTINPYAALATIRSQANYSDKIGPATIQLGGSRTQYPGREQVDQTVPTLTVNTGTLNLASWLSWTPSFSYTGSQSLHLDTPGPFAYRYFRNPAKADSVDSTLTKRNSYSSSTTFDTPIRIFGYDLRNNFQVTERVLDYPQTMQITDVKTGEVLGNRIFPKGYETDINWQPQFTLPPLARNLFNITPSVSLSNATSGPFWLRTNLSNGQFVHQTLRPTFGLSASPTIFGLLPGFGPFTRFRHSIQPTITYNYAPSANVSDAYLQALGRSRKNEFVGLQSNMLSFGLTQNIEAKIRTPSDTSPDQAQKIKLLTLNFTPLSYNIDQARAAHSAIRGLTTDNFSYSLRSDLLPSFNFQEDFSLFQGSTLSDTARFKPFRTRITAGLSLSRDNNPFAVFTRLFGRAVPESRLPNPSTQGTPGNPPDDAYARQIASQPVAGSGANNSRFLVPTTQGWSASLSFTSARSRPPVGNANVVVLDPRQRCEDLGQSTGNPLIRDACLQQIQSGINPTATPEQLGIAGATQYISPPTTNLMGQFSFGITPNWSASWNTSYDFVRHEFAEHMVTLQRDLHDWRAVFSFTRSPNGNFAFSFFVALKAEPDLKFDYNKATIRSGAF